MTAREKTKPAALFANGYWNGFTGRKKYSIACGKCSHSWQEKVPFVTSDIASVLCPCCGTQNVWSHAEFGRDFQKYLASRYRGRHSA